MSDLTTSKKWLAPEMDSAEIATVRAFIRAINAGDVRGLADLMTDDHTFVDSAGKIVSGRAAMEAGWAGYLEMFPDYEIQVDDILQSRELVAVFGSTTETYDGKRGVVPENRISGPAAWKAIVQDGKVRHWQVYADWTEGWKVIERDKLAD